jgi:hypothetical protein
MKNIISVLIILMHPFFITLNANADEKFDLIKKDVIFWLSTDVSKDGKTVSDIQLSSLDCDPSGIICDICIVFFQNDKISLDRKRFVRFLTYVSLKFSSDTNALNEPHSSICRRRDFQKIF